MSWIVGGVIAVAAVVAQLGVMPTLLREPLAAPALPIAVIAAWATLRGMPETAPAFLLSAIALGVASEERVGWFVLALLPTVVFVTVLSQRRGIPAVALAAGGAAFGVVSYQAVLGLADGAPQIVIEEASLILVAALATACCSAALAAPLWMFRPRPAGLFE